MSAYSSASFLGNPVLWVVLLTLGLMFWVEPELLEGMTDVAEQIVAWFKHGWKAKTYWI